MSNAFRFSTDAVETYERDEQRRDKHQGEAKDSGGNLSRSHGVQKHKT